MAEVTLANIVKVPLIPASRISVHNATGSKLGIGTAVKMTGTETTGIPNVAACNALTDAFLGVLYEDIEDGKDGLCVCGAEIVEIVVNAEVTQGGFAGLSTTAGRFENLVATQGNTIAGMFIGGAGTQAAGDKVRMLIMHGVA